MISTITKHKKEEKQRFIAMFHSLEAALNGMKSHPLHHYRKMAMDKFAGLPFPTLKTEAWKYTPVASILNQEYQLADRNQQTTKSSPDIIDALDAYRISIHNGLINIPAAINNLLPKGVWLGLLSDALEHPMLSGTVKNAIQKSIENAENPFELLSLALCQDGIYLHVPRNTVIEKPFLIQYHTSEGNNIAGMFGAFNCEANAAFTLVESFTSYLSESDTYFNCPSLAFSLGDGARVKHYRIQEEAAGGSHIQHTDIVQDGNSTYSAINLDLGGKLVRNNLKTVHTNPGVHTDFIGAYLGAGRQHIDNYTLIDHAVPHCTSNELYKGILSGQSKGVFNGRVMVRQDAQKTNAFQQNSSLVLSDKAMMYTKPQLEIFADDVRCSHGATIGQLDENAVFYLRSRGLTDTEARAMLQFAFIAEVLEHLELEAVKNYCLEAIDQKLKNT